MEQILETIYNPWAIARLHRLLSGLQEIALVCHARPDGDAIGSTVGLAHLLRDMGYRVHCIAPSGVPAPIAWVPGNEMIIEYESNSSAVREILSRAELLFCLDHNDVARTDQELAADIHASQCPRVMIDHHLFPTGEFDLQFSHPDASSTCEMVYELISRAWGESLVTPEVANCLYMGLMTDTGSFAHSCERLRTFEVGGQLVAHGANVSAIRNHVFGSYRESRIRLYGYALHKRMQIIAQGQASLIALTRYSLDEFDYQPGDTEGLVNEPLGIAGVNVSVLLTERNSNSVRVSLRSRNGVIVNEIAQRFFNGGGHAQASGGTLRMDFKAAQEYTLRVLEEFLA